MILTYNKLGKNGRFGNQLFQIASTIGIANQAGMGYCFPKWEYQKYFENQLPRERPGMIHSLTGYLQDYRNFTESEDLNNALATLWMIFRIEPDEQAYLGFDDFNYTSCNYTEIGDTQYIHSRFVSANNPYLAEFGDRYYNFIEDDGIADQIIFDVKTGGVTLYEDLLISFYNALDAALELLNNKYQNSLSLLDLLLWMIGQILSPNQQDIIESYYLLTLVMWLDRNPEFVDWYISSIVTFNDFIDTIFDFGNTLVIRLSIFLLFSFTLEITDVQI